MDRSEGRKFIGTAKQLVGTPDFLRILSHLLESNVLGVLSEALTADVKLVFSDETGDVAAYSASSRSLSVLSRSAEPNVFVSHDC